MVQEKYQQGLAILYWRPQGLKAGSDSMIDLKYSLVIEATDDPTFFGFYSLELEGFTGVGHSIEDCLYKAKWGIEEHMALLKEKNLPIPRQNPNPTVTIQNQEQLSKTG